MLSPSQLLPFLQHADREVRAEAIRYFAEASDPVPATAADLWRSIDRFGIAESEPALRALPELPDTETSTRRLLAALRDAPSDETWLRLIAALDALDLPMLGLVWDELDALREHLPPRSLAHLAERRRLAAEHVPPAALWQGLLDHAAEIDGQSAYSFDRLVSIRLVEALARHPEDSAERARSPARRRDRRLARDFCHRASRRVALAAGGRSTPRQTAHRWRGGRSSLREKRGCPGAHRRRQGGGENRGDLRG